MRRCLACDSRFDDLSWRCPACGWQPTAQDVPQFAPELAVEANGFHPEMFEKLARLEPTSFWFRGRRKLIVWALRRYFPQARSLFEVGCGSGYMLRAFHEECPDVRLTGSDLFVEGLSIARQRLPGIPLLQVDARNLPFDAEFDVAGAFDVLEHVDDDERVLSELHRTVKPGGGLLITVPQHPWLWSAADDFGQHKRRYRRSELVAKLHRAGFTLRRVTSFVTVLLPVLVLSRLRPARPHTVETEPFAEFLLPRPLDRSFELLLDLERRAIERGVFLPAGGSLLAVATRPR